MKKQMNNDIISSSILLIISFIVLAILFGYPLKTSFFPKIVTIYIAVLCLISILTTILKKDYFNKTKTVFFSKKFFIIILLVPLYLYAIPKLGYFSSTFLFFNLSLSLLGIKITKGFIISIFTLLFIFVFFQVILALHFPRGILFWDCKTYKHFIKYLVSKEKKRGVTNKWIFI